MTDQEKEEIQGQILDALEDALGQKLIEEEEVKEIARFVVENIKAVNGQEALVKFFADLKGKWPIFKNLYNAEQGKIDQGRDLIAANKAADLATRGKIEEALDVAKAALEN